MKDERYIYFKETPEYTRPTQGLRIYILDTENERVKIYSINPEYDAIRSCMPWSCVYNFKQYREYFNDEFKFERVTKTNLFVELL